MTEKEKKSKEPLEAFDALGQKIVLDAVVAAPYTRSMLLIGRIVKISPKTVKIRRLGHPSDSGEQKYHHEVVVISDNPATTMYVLQKDNPIA